MELFSLEHIPSQFIEIGEFVLLFFRETDLQGFFKADVGINSRKFPAEPADGGQDSQVVQNVRPQVGGKSPNFIGSGLGYLDRRLQRFANVRLNFPGKALQAALDAKLDGRQILPQPIMELLSDPFPFSFLRREELMG